MNHLFLIIGDPFLREQKTGTLIAEFQKNSKEAFSTQRFRLDEISLETVLVAARTLPFFSSGQVLRVQEADLLKENDISVLGAYLENPAPQTILIFEADELKAGSDLQRLVNAKGQVITFAREGTRSMGAVFLKQKLAQLHKSMTPDASARLFAMCGDEIAFLDTMVERLAQFSGAKSQIDETMVNQFEENWAEMDVFKLTQALIDRDPGRTLQVFRELMERFEADLVSIIGILHWQLKQLWQAVLLREEGTPEREIGSRLRMPPAKISALRKFSLEHLETALEELFQIDKKTKTGQWDGVSSLEAWLLRNAS